MDKEAGKNDLPILFRYVIIVETVLTKITGTLHQTFYTETKLLT